MILLLTALHMGGYYFADTTIYDPELHSLREGVHFLVDDQGLMGRVAREPVAEVGDATVIRGALVLPHYTDFYSLIQERGLGLDEDIDATNQGRLARYLRSTGFAALRDPVFPPGSLATSFARGPNMLAQAGYLTLEGGPAADFAVVLDPEEPLPPDALPAAGPVTLWWTSAGDEQPLTWPDEPEFLRQLIARCHGEGRKLGIYIQDADDEEMAAARGFDFDFLEGIPAGPVDPAAFPAGIVWVPLASLNDKRYCARALDKNLARLSGMSLYDTTTLALAQERLDSIFHRIQERCAVWRNRRQEALTPLSKWIGAGGAIAVGSGGGHLFAFSGDIRGELEVLDELGASQVQLLTAIFETTPALLGVAESGYLAPGRKASFNAYRDASYWLTRVGTRVDFNFMDGKLVEELPLTLTK